VVDDVTETRDLYVECLRLAGWRAAAVSDGTAALCLAREIVPDLLLLVLELPVLDGWSVMKRLADDAATSGIPIVALTSRLDDAVRRAARAAGCRMVLARACSPEELVASAASAIAAPDVETET
jgi:CheY-like chemotaxis protein